MTAQDVYSQSVRRLSPEERFRLATLILDELTRGGKISPVMESRDVWTEEDRTDVTAFSLDYAAARYPEDEDLI